MWRHKHWSNGQRSRKLVNSGSSRITRTIGSIAIKEENNFTTNPQQTGTHLSEQNETRQ